MLFLGGEHFICFSAGFEDNIYSNIISLSLVGRTSLSEKNGVAKSSKELEKRRN